MARVILITSREIKNSTSIHLNFKGYDELNPDWANGYLVQFSKHWVKNISLIQDDEKSRIKEAIQKATTPEGAKKLSEDVVTKIRTQYKTSSSPFKLGIFYTKREDTHVYFAEEYPFGFNNEFGDGEQRYLNSLIAEIENHLKTTLHVTEKEAVEWQIFSHDKDWCLNESNGALDKEVTIGKVKNEFGSLKNVLTNSNTTIRVFQHITSDYTYLYVKYLIENESPMLSFEDFIQTGKKQMDKVTELLIKEDFNPADFLKLKIDPNYPFLDFDKLLSM